MSSYMIHFTIYTLAMCGLIFFALFVYKKVMSGNFHSKGTKFLDIEETMYINPRKSILVVRAGKERFLVASDVDRTSLISKLSDSQTNENTEFETQENKSDELIVQDELKTNFDTIYPPVKLELIKNKNTEKRRTRKIKPEKTIKRKSTVDKIDPMKEMAKRINEL